MTGKLPMAFTTAAAVLTILSLSAMFASVDFCFLDVEPLTKGSVGSTSCQ